MSEIQLKNECKECKYINVVPLNTMILSWKEPEKKKSMMKASYTNNPNIRSVVAHMVSTYKPEGLFEHKTYEELIGELGDEDE